MTALIVAIVTSIATGTTNYFVATNLFDEERQERKAEKSAEMMSLIGESFQSAATRRSYINSNNVEYHFYEAIALALQDERAPVILQMREGQEKIAAENWTHVDAFNTHVSSYEWRLKHLQRWADDPACVDGLMSSASQKLAKSVEFDPSFLDFAKRAQATGQLPYQAIGALKSEDYKDLISFETEVMAFATEMETCLGHLAKDK